MEKNFVDHEKHTFTLYYHDFTDGPHVAAMGPYAFTTYFMIKRHINSISGEGFPSYDRLMKLTGMSRARIAKSIQELEELGYIRVEKRKTTKGEKNIYHLTNPTEIAAPNKAKRKLSDKAQQALEAKRAEAADRLDVEAADSQDQNAAAPAPVSIPEAAAGYGVYAAVVQQLQGRTNHVLWSEKTWTTKVEGLDAETLEASYRLLLKESKQKTVDILLSSPQRLVATYGPQIAQQKKAAEALESLKRQAELDRLAFDRQQEKQKREEAEKQKEKELKIQYFLENAEVTEREVDLLTIKSAEEFFLKHPNEAPTAKQNIHGHFYRLKKPVEARVQQFQL